MNRIRTPAVAVSAMFVLNGALFGAWASRVPSFKDAFALSPDRLGLLLLLLAGGGILSFAATGEAVGRFGAIKVTRTIAYAYCAALIVLALVPNIWLLALALFAFGVTHGSMDVAMNAFAAEVEATGKRAIMPFFHAMWSLGAGAGALFGSLAIGAGLDTLTHFAIFAVVAGTACLALAAVDWTSSVEEATARGPIVAFPKGALALVGLAVFAATMGEGAMADWAAIFLIETAGARESVAPLGYAVFATFMVGTRLSGGFVIARLGAAGAARASGALAATGFLIAVMATGVPMVLSGLALVGVGTALIFPLSMTRAANSRSQSPGRAIAAMATCGYGGMLLGPPVIGFIADRSSFESSFLLLAALAVLVAVLAGSMRPRSD